MSAALKRGLSAPAPSYASRYIHIHIHIHIHTHIHIHIHIRLSVHASAPNAHWLPDGVGTKVCFTIVAHVWYKLPHFAKCGMTILSKIAMKVDRGKPWRFCGDPVCPDPVRKPSKHGYINTYIIKNGNTT